MQLFVKGCGIVSTLGFNFESTCAAMRAGISGGEIENLYCVETGSNISACKVHLPQWWEGTEKASCLLSPAIKECIAKRPEASLDTYPVLIGIAPEQRPFQPKDLKNKLLKQIECQLESSLHPASGVFANGQCSVVFALLHAKKLIQQGIPGCIVAGVDSYLHQGLVRHYMDSNRILTEINPNGFIPGEAGCAVLVSSIGGNDNELEILGIGLGKETGTIESEKPLTGNGLTRAVQNALDDSGYSYFDIDFRMTDLNGEHYKFSEAQIMEGRIGRKFDKFGNNRDKFRDIWHPIEYLGEIGAAIGPCLLSWACHAGVKQYLPGPMFLIHLSNDDGERAAIIAQYRK